MMAGIVRFLLIFFSILPFIIAFPSTEESLTVSRPDTKTPDEDDFYQPPPGYELAAPGSILRYRPVPNGISLNNKTPLWTKAAWQLLYRTQNSVGEPEASVVTVIIPYNAKRSNLFVYAYTSLAASSACNPSVTMQNGTRDDNATLQLQNILIVMALMDGWIVSVADDSGKQAAFSAGLHSAYATLDSLRAVRQSGHITGISSNPTTTIYGYSAGAGVAAWATEMQPSYAPDVKIAGIAVGGLIPNITHNIKAYNNNPWSMFGPATLLGLSHDYANLSKWLDENLVPERAAEFRKAEHECFFSYYKYENQDLGMYLKRGFESIYDPIPFSVMKSGGVMGMRGTPTVPWYLYESVGDDGSPVELADALAEKYCRNGASIFYERNLMNLSHNDEATFGFTKAYTWLRDRQEGKPVEPGCKKVLIPNRSLKVLDVLDHGLLWRLYWDAFVAYAGAPLGLWGGKR